jgi:hypothetical protein
MPSQVGTLPWREASDGDVVGAAHEHVLVEVTEVDPTSSSAVAVS